MHPPFVVTTFLSFRVTFLHISSHFGGFQSTQTHKQPERSTAWERCHRLCGWSCLHWYVFIARLLQLWQNCYKYATKIFLSFTKENNSYESVGSSSRLTVLGQLGCKGCLHANGLLLLQSAWSSDRSCLLVFHELKSSFGTRLISRSTARHCVLAHWSW